MKSTFDVGDVVATTKALRQDGTFPDPNIATGQILVEPGTRGEVINVGLYLQEHIVYAVAFENGRVVGALERELEAAVRETSPSSRAADATAHATSSAADSSAAVTSGTTDKEEGLS
ncbi:nitrogen fixation protein NifZ [Frankia sp. Mgl5]|uniref:nitrogen fixation protein NifZ n=1 Tax=Frankiaceae TaxID=74712 RepID=UPI0000540279|nr:nitrogen fixation protein NifZ [Frankia sp. Mgl5]ABW16206.1 NifZ family protein [Frankia sp. EAN1pec]MCK9929175.1 nitrogen fixation protein NifZ [Frankia sp. Mgl5]